MKRYNQEGYNTRIIEGYHTDRDAAMTETSDYDILWVRGDAETAALYGSKYRPGRVSGTQKNKERRLLKEQRAIP
jgi:TorA maturation chaperone TorD